MIYARMKKNISRLLPLLIPIIFFGCSLAVQTATDSTEYLPFITPEAPTNCKATFCDTGAITLSFDSTDYTASGYKQYYLVHYFLGPDFDTEKTLIIPSSEGVSHPTYTFSGLSANTQMLFNVESIITYTDLGSGKTTKMSSGASTYFEGCTQLEIADPLIVQDGSKFSISWAPSLLFSALDRSDHTLLFDSLSYRVTPIVNDEERTPEVIVVALDNLDFSYTTDFSLSAANVSFRIEAEMTKDGKTITPAVLTTDAFLTDVSYVPLPVKDIRASQGTKSNAVDVSWTLDAINGGVVNATQSVSLQRSVAGAGLWTTLLSFSADQSAYLSDGSYLFTDTSVDLNTEYDYRAVTYYYLGDTSSYVKQDDTDAMVTSQTGYAIFLPKNLLVSSSYDNSVGSVDAVLNWSSVKEKPTTAHFYLKRIDLKVQMGVENSKLIELADTDYVRNPDGTFSYTDVIDLSEISPDAKDLDHSFTYAVGLKYEDSSYSATSRGNSSADYTTAFEKIDFITGAQASSGHSDKILVSAAINTSAMASVVPSLDASKIVYSVFRDSTSDGIYATSAIANSTDNPTQFVLSEDAGVSRITFTDPSLGSAVSYYYIITATYTDSGNLTYNGKSTSSAILSGQTLGLPVNLSATMGKSQSEITLSVTPATFATATRLYYRVKGATDWETGGLFPENNTYSFTEGAQTATAGTIYEFAAASVGDEGFVSEKCTPVEGCLFGPALLNTRATTAASSADSITVSWDDVAGANGYAIQIYLNGNYLDAIYDGMSGNSHIFRQSDSLFSVSDANPYPLSESYEFKVVPYDADSHEISTSLIASVSGAWFGPPREITVSQGLYGQKVQIAWTAVDGATGYNLYASDDNASWSFVAKTSTNSYTDITNDKKYYTTEAIDNAHSLVSVKQRDFKSGKSNYGYRLAAPVIAVSSDAERDYYFVQWQAVEGATGYYIYDNGTSSYVDVSGLVSGSTLGNSTERGYLALSSDGLTYSYNYAGSEITHDYQNTNHAITMTSYRAFTEGSGESSVSSNTVDAYRRLTSKEIVYVLNTGLSESLHAADTQFSGDWWPALNSQNTYTNAAGTVTIKSVKSWTGSQGDGGTFAMSGYAVGTSQYVLECAETLAIFAKADGDAQAGYLGTDPLKTLSAGSFTLTMPPVPYSSAQYTIETTEINVIDKTGTFTVKSGSTVLASYAYADLSVQPY